MSPLHAISKTNLPLLCQPSFESTESQLQENPEGGKLNNGNKTSFHFAKEQFIAHKKSTGQRKFVAAQFCRQPAQCLGTQFASQRLALTPEFIFAWTQIEFPPQVQPRCK